MRWRIARRALTVGAAAIVAVVAAALWLDQRYPPVLDRYEDLSRLVVDRDGGVLRAYTTTDGMWRLPAGVTDVSPAYLDMLIAYEDRRYRWHPGVDPLALARAAAQAVRHGRIVSGGSTLTMQTARLLQPRPARTLGAKLVEMARALQLEWHFDKHEILSIYLTLAPFGGNLEGVRAASLAYFDKEPASLTLDEAALLVSLPQSPSLSRPDRAPDRARHQRDKVLTRLADSGVLDDRAAAEALAAPVPNLRRPLPFRAPHLADRLAAAHPGETHITTFIDGDLQTALEELAADHLSGLDARANIALMVADHATGAVRAHVGSADFFAEARAGQIDLTRAVRSPGSTLKPFVYALGFEDRLIHPDTLVRDAPRRFGAYAPSNFDPVYAGDVTVAEALIRSLNIPAVAVLDRIGPARLTARLAGAGAALRLYEPDAPPGLAIALGGAGTTLADLVTLYAGLARGGRAPALRFTPLDGPAGTERLVARPEAAWYVTGILAAIPPPSTLVDPAYIANGRRIAYKTGTSYGFRDAWAVGYDRDHTVGVWVGRPDGTPSPARYGRNTAAPILFRVFQLLPTPGGDVLGPAPANVIDTQEAALPDRLRHFDGAGPAVDASGAARLGDRPVAIAFPVDGARLDLPRLPDGFDTVPLEAEGGQRPLVWLVNDRPLPAGGPARTVEWRPDGRGFARITVIDAAGDAASVAVWVE